MSQTTRRERAVSTLSLQVSVFPSPGPESLHVFVPVPGSGPGLDARGGGAPAGGERSGGWVGRVAVGLTSYGMVLCEVVPKRTTRPRPPLPPPRLRVSRFATPAASFGSVPAATFAFAAAFAAAADCCRLTVGTAPPPGAYTRPLFSSP